MFKRYTFWLWSSIVMMFLTAGAHSLSFLVDPVPQNETEKQLLDLMMNYHQDLGGGFHPTMVNILNALSACFPILYVLGGVTLLYLRKKVGPDILKGLVGIYVIIFGFTFAIMAFLTFLPPIVMTGMVFLLLLATYFTIPRLKA